MNEGWISRRKGRFVYRFMTVRASDGKRVENLKVIGLISDLKTEKAALIEATKKGIHESRLDTGYRETLV